MEDLLTMLHDSSASVRIRAAGELGRRNDKSAIGPLSQALDDSDELVRVNAAKALLNLGDRSGVKVLKKVLSSSSIHNAVSAALVLAENGDFSGLEVAKENLHSDSSTVRGYAIGTVGLCKDESLAYSALEGGLKESDQFIRMRVIRLLGERPTKRSLDLLGPVMSSPDRVERMLAARAIGNVRLYDGIPLLLKALFDSDGGVRSWAAVELNNLTQQHRPAHATSDERTVGQARQEWLDWWEANKQNYPFGQRAPAPPVPPATRTGERFGL